ncbi:MAG: hypothetical protein HY047_04240 [Acidobacteria bacterium]|nr:hypothetical protein [Acidobacteriota bacterium]
MIESPSRRRVLGGAAALLALGASVGACRRAAPPAPALATPSVKLSRDKTPLGSPLDITYRFEVARDARFDQDYRVFVHVLDVDGELMWNDDHVPSIATSQWTPGQVVEYTRTVFVPIYPYVGDATIQIGLYSPSTQKRPPLAGEDMGQRAYKVARLTLQPQTENIFTNFDTGWNTPEVAEHNAMVQWQWTKKEAALKFRNPKKDCMFYLDVDQPAKSFAEPQQVRVSLGGQTIEEFALASQQQVLKKTALTAAQLGTSDVVEILIAVDKTFTPSMRDPTSKDTRELGIRVYHAFIDAR